MTIGKRIFCLIVVLLVHPAARGADDSVPGGGTRLRGTLSFTCTPDEKSKKAGAEAFEDSLDVDNDRVKSTKLSAEGFPVALSIPTTAR